jgi:hypothetical protein
MISMQWSEMSRFDRFVAMLLPLGIVALFIRALFFI